MSDVLNTEMLAELRDIMEDEFPSLIQTFLEESARQYAAVQSAWETGDAELLRRAAHSLKGSCGNIGAQALHDTCADLEYSAKDGVLNEVPALLSTVQAQLDAVHEAVRALH